jgi:DNA-binding transcriptional LysR family regulator
VRDHDHRSAILLPEPQQLVLQVHAGEDVEQAERLVEQQHAGLEREGAGDAEALKDLAQRRLGVAVVPAWAARRELASGALVGVRMGPMGLGRSWGVLHADLQPYPATLRAFIRLLADSLPDLLKRAA